MSDPNNSEQPPEQPKSKGHRFQKGHKFGKGRKPGAIGKKTLREKLLNGLARSGAKKAQKAGLNKNVDGFEFFIEDLANSNSSAAASLASKLISLEPPPTDNNGFKPLAVNIINADSGSFLTRKQTTYYSEHKILPPDDNEMHSSGAVKFHDANGRYPTAEELAATAAASNNGFEDVRGHYSPPPVFTGDFEQKIPDPILGDNVIHMPGREKLDEDKMTALLERRLNNMSAEERKVLSGLFEGLVDLPDAG